MPTFSFVDGAIVVVYLLASVAVGLIANRCITGLTGYLVAGRSLGTALAIATMTGSELGLITVMYQAQKGFTGGFAALHIGLPAGLVTLFVGLTGFIVVPLRRARVMTIPEYYQQRFGRKTRILGGVLLAVGGILNMGLFLRIGSQFVVGVTGIDPAGGTIVAVMVVLLLLVLF
ncbi:MAG: sodium:solute symporter family transporter, partial [Planctomycetota bacterium]